MRDPVSNIIGYPATNWPTIAGNNQAIYAPIINILYFQRIRRVHGKPLPASVTKPDTISAHFASKIPSKCGGLRI
jgi:hypothetical protein